MHLPLQPLTNNPNIYHHNSAVGALDRIEMKNIKKYPANYTGGNNTTSESNGVCNCMMPIAISVEQAAKLLGIGRSTAYVLKTRGELPTFLLGGKTLVPVQALREMVARMSGTGMEAC